MNGPVVQHAKNEHIAEAVIAGQSLATRRIAGLLSMAGGAQGSSVLTRAELDAAAAAIRAKANDLGTLPGQPQADVVSIADGYVGRYEGCDIYFTPEHGAHEIHGDIRAKYNALVGPPWLGLPITDETATPDGLGRFNHFDRSASIYWTAHTGPMLVRGAIRDIWAGMGWERGELGYPVADEHRLKTTAPVTDPVVLWSIFENGAILASRDGAKPVTRIAVPPDVLRLVVHRRFDKQIHESPENLGLYPQIETVRVSDWSYGFWQSDQRALLFRLHGFRDNGLASDTTFTVDLTLRLDFVPSDSLLEPDALTPYASLLHGSAFADGLGADEISQGLIDAIVKEFTEPVALGDPIATGAITAGSDANIDLVGIITSADGGLSVLLNPFMSSEKEAFIELVIKNAVDALTD